MNYTCRGLVLTAQEFEELKAAIGEHRRICRDQVYRYVKGEYLQSDNQVSRQRLEIAESILIKLNEVEYHNKNIQ